MSTDGPSTYGDINTGAIVWGGESSSLACFSEIELAFETIWAL